MLEIFKMNTIAWCKEDSWSDHVCKKNGVGAAQKRYVYIFSINH